LQNCQETGIVPKVTNIKKARNARDKTTSVTTDEEGFCPCSQDMTICGDCEGNRANQKCPRLKEWLAKKLN
jgi:hypothetical protein